MPGTNGHCLEEAEGAFRRAVADLIAGRLSSALENLKRCLARDPGFAPAHSIRAAVYLRQDRLEEAREEIDRALELRPGSSVYLHNRAVIWTALERYDQAIEDYEAALRIDPGAAGTRNNLAWALAHALEAVRCGDNPRWLDTLAAAYAECGDFVSAVATEEEACRRSRPPSELFRRRLEAYRDGRTFAEWREASTRGF